MARDDGSLILSGSGGEFHLLVRNAVETAGEDFVALPVRGGAGYERLIIIPM
ncbi:hypothetical protein [Brevundimonas sp.]|uniref:hypothetical protein n=1 Tax=Brevundimonas sp. TaxID=1871086 RepID=UPI002D694C96|nr:hypothetical protein [Brevundimonas sp.]HYC68845.1 hypothetical protein [Brevundimonas sp.]